MKISKGFYIGSYIAGMTLTIILIAIGLSRRRIEEGMPFILAAYIPMIFACVVYWVLYYKTWSAIQDGYARTTPGKAIGFLFIPFFNLYWVFQVTWGLAKDYNAFLDRHSINAGKLSEGFFLSLPIFVLATIIPVIGPIFILVTFVLNIIIISKLADALNALPEDLSNRVAPGSLGITA